ncbi:MAG TPA: hypothetical protein VEX62_08420 [Candidatus Limnocylindrales bacterium]|nr:hypothetical protein [Candidatus Limnocylindrales bacterium]
MSASKSSRPESPAPSPAYRVIVIPWLRRPAQRLILPNWLAITIWRWIFAWRALDEVELAHELTHVRQWLEHGFVGFIRSYMAESSRAKKDGGDRYRENRFEVEARAAEDEARTRRG